MAEDTPTPAEQTTEAAQAAAPEAADAGATDRGTGSGGEMDAATMRKLLKEAREEAASYRVRARDAERKLEGYVPRDKLEEARARAAELEAELSRTRLAAKYDLPPTIAARISGSTEEEREADAKALADELSTLNRGAVRVGRGGLDPTADSLPTDPAALAARIPRSRH